MTLQQFLDYRKWLQLSDRFHYQFQLWLNRERKLRNPEKSVDMWKDLYNDFLDEVNEGITTPLNLRPNKRY